MVSAPPPSCPAHSPDAAHQHTQPQQKISPTLTQTQMLMAQQIKMITGEELADDFLRVIQCGPPSPNFLPMVRSMSRGDFSWKDIIFDYEDGEFGPQVVISTQEIDREHADIYHFQDINANDLFSALKNAGLNKQKPHFVEGKWAYNPPISYVEYSQRDTSKEIPNVIVHAPQLGTMNYKMILGKHACIVTAEEYETIKNIFSHSDFDPRIIEVYFSARYCRVSIPKTKKSTSPLGVYSTEDWRRFNKLGQRFLYAHIREALKQVWDEETKVIFLKRIKKIIARKKRIKKFFRNTETELSLRKEDFFEEGKENTGYLKLVHRADKIAYISHILVTKKACDRNMSDEIARYIFDEFEDRTSWSECFAPLISAKIHPSTARAIMQARYFSGTGMNDDTHGRKDLRGGFIDFEVKDIGGGLDIVQDVIPALFFKIRSLAGRPLQMTQYQSALTSLLKPLLRIVMRSSGSDLQVGTPSDPESFLKILNIQFDASTNTCTYTLPPEADIQERKKRIQETESVGCPALFVPGMVEELTDFYLKELIWYTEEI